MAFEVAEKEANLKSVVFVGVDGAGLTVARFLASEMKKTFQIDVPVTVWLRSGSLQNGLTCYGKNIVIVDDVIFSGSTLLRLMLTVPDLAEAATVRIAALVDRGHRRFPVEADVVGLYAPTKLNEHIDVVFEQNAFRVILHK
jgi:pyrimidine operon attenuation protein/uracil phosphoribosyltransferase